MTKIRSIQKQKEMNPKSRNYYGVSNVEYKFLGTGRDVKRNQRVRFKMVCYEYNYWDALDKLEKYLISKNVTKFVRFKVYKWGARMDKKIRIG